MKIARRKEQGMARQFEHSTFYGHEKYSFVKDEQMLAETDLFWGEYRMDSLVSGSGPLLH